GVVPKPVALLPAGSVMGEIARRFPGQGFALLDMGEAALCLRQVEQRTLKFGQEGRQADMLVHGSTPLLALADRSRAAAIQNASRFGAAFRTASKSFRETSGGKYPSCLPVW